MIMSSEQRAAHVAELADALASGASEVTLVQVQVLSWALQVVKGLTANRRESFFHWSVRLGGKLGGRFGFAFGLRLSFRVTVKFSDSGRIYRLRCETVMTFHNS